MRNTPVRTACLFSLSLAVILLSRANGQAQTSTITCTPASAKADGIEADYWVWGTGSFTYTPANGFTMLGIWVQYGTLDAEGKFVPRNAPGDVKAALDMTQKTWNSSSDKAGVRKGDSIWIRARIDEFNMMTMEKRTAAVVISKYTAPNN